MPATSAVPAAVGLHRPDLGEVRAVLTRALGEREAVRVWSDLLSIADLTGYERDPTAGDRVLKVMADADRVLQMCRMSICIKIQHYDFMAALCNATGRDRP